MGRSGDGEVGRSGGREVGRSGDGEVGRSGGREVGRSGGREVGRWGGREVGRIFMNKKLFFISKKTYPHHPRHPITPFGFATPLNAGNPRTGVDSPSTSAIFNSGSEASFKPQVTSLRCCLPVPYSPLSFEPLNRVDYRFRENQSILRLISESYILRRMDDN